jgi:hypothetical protein
MLRAFIEQIITEHPMVGIIRAPASYSAFE